MKRCWNGIIGVLLAVLMVGCSANHQATVFDDVSYGDAFYSQNTFVLCNVTELQAHIDEYHADTFSESYSQRLQSYDEAFFQDYKLVAIYHEDPTTSSALSVKEIEHSNDQIIVVIKRKTPDIVSDTMKDYAILVEIPQAEKCLSATYEILNNK